MVPSSNSAGIEVFGLLLAGLGGGAEKKRAEPSLPTGKAEGWEFAVVGGGEMSVSSDISWDPETRRRDRALGIHRRGWGRGSEGQWVLPSRRSTTIW